MSIAPEVPTRILHIISTAEPPATGIVRLVRTLARNLDPGRYQHVAWFLLGDGPLRQELESVGVQTRLVRWRPSPRDPVGALRFWNALRHERLDILHQHFGDHRLRRLVRWTTGAPILLHLHGRVAETANPVPVPLPTQGADLVVATSRAVADCAMPGPARVIYPAIEPGAPLPVSVTSPASRSLVIGTAGRLIPLKRVDDLLRAFASIAARFPAATLEIAGSGPESEPLARLAAELKIGQRVRFLGWLPDVKPTMRTWHIYAQVSLDEGLPVSVLEAMDAALPVVATAVGGVPEAVEDGATGWLVPPRDAAAIADRLAALLADAALRHRMGVTGHNLLQKRFSPQRFAQEISALYSDLLRSRNDVDP